MRNNFVIILMTLFLSLAVYANDDNEVDTVPMCNYGGWMSFFDKEGNCLPPWKSIVREDDGIADYGHPYTSKYSCGANGLFRCNPLVFGPGESGKGHCVSTNDKDPNAATKACLEKMDFEARQDHIQRLSENPEAHAKYIGVAAETIRFCKKSDAEYCDELESILTKSTKQLATCTDKTKLYQYLPYVVTPVNQNEINQIANNLVPGFEAYLEDLERRREEAIAHNEKVYEDALKAYTESSKTQTMIKTLKENTTKCLEKSCFQKDGKTKKRTVYYDKKTKKYKKSAKKSMAYCFRYVKYGMVGKDNYSDVKDDVPGKYAVHAGRSLERRGFTNVLDNPAFQGMTPQTAPIGAIIVYKRKGASQGRPGHIEVRTAEKEYTSDFINSRPTTVGGTRIPIGIYMKLPDDLDKKLMEVPNE